MSWDLWVINYDGPLNLDDFRDDCVTDLGPLTDVRQSISTSWPDTSWDDDRHGCLRRREYSIDVYLPEPQSLVGVGCLNLHVYGKGDPVSPIVQLCRESGWQVIDKTRGEFLDLQRPSGEGWEHFRESRDRVVRGGE